MARKSQYSIDKKVPHKKGRQCIKDARRINKVSQLLSNYRVQIHLVHFVKVLGELQPLKNDKSYSNRMSSLCYLHQQSTQALFHCIYQAQSSKHILCFIHTSYQLHYLQCLKQSVYNDEVRLSQITTHLLYQVHICGALDPQKLSFILMPINPYLLQIIQSC